MDEMVFQEEYTSKLEGKFDDSPIVTGDPVIDALERSLHANLKRGKGVPDGW